MLPRPDCCETPTLRALLVITNEPDGENLLERCANCQAFWRVFVQERMNMDGDADPTIQTFERLSNHEADDLLFGTLGS
jgi:hypothetical protein